MSALISEEYRKMQQDLHQNPNYGVASVQYAPTVADILNQVRPTELLDYGAGKGRLGETLKTLMPSPPAIRHYDPARPDWSATPQPAPFVTCIDVLEHIEPELLDNVLDVTVWPLPQQEQEAGNKRRIGLGFTGLGDALIMLGLRYDTQEAREMAGKIAQAMRDESYLASVDLAQEKGAFPLFDA